VMYICHRDHQTLHGSILSHNASIVSVHGFPQIFFEPPLSWTLSMLRIRIWL
jgi:hypothetical protein